MVLITAWRQGIQEELPRNLNLSCDRPQEANGIHYVF